VTAQPLTADQARSLVADALHGVVPEADLGVLADDVPFRAELELDSLDFLVFVERLSAASGVRIDESDYAELTTLASCVDFLTDRR
jgi:acyl carrier protein